MLSPLAFTKGAVSYQSLGLAYGPHERHRLDLCIPAVREARGPAVLLIHGGGWVGGDKSAFASQCRYFSDHGIVAASVEYRLGDGRAENAWPAQLVDVQLAVRWLRANANRLRIDPKRICAYGHSAGGQLAIWLAAEKSIYPGDYATELADASPAVSCAVDNFGLVEFTATPRYDSLIPLLFPGENTASRERLSALSPLPAIASSTCPIFISHGLKDDVVAVDQSRNLSIALKRSRVSAHFLTFDGGHEFVGMSPSAKSAILALELDFILRSAPID